MAVLNICTCVLRLKDQLGNAYSAAELMFEPRKSQLHTVDSLYVNRPVRATAVPGVVVQDLLYVAQAATLAASPSVYPITVTYTGGGTAGSETVTVVGSDITVDIESGVSTALQVKTAVLASAAALALVDVIISGTGATAQVTAASTTLSDYYCVLKLAETTTTSQMCVFEVNWYDGRGYNSIIFDPILVPDQAYLDLSTTLTTSRG